jgi:uncharacterized protein (DUF885 family)
MFNNRKTKILSAPAEEVLEVVEPVVEEEPKLQQVSNIEFLTLETDAEENATGTLTDYDGNSYSYEWDKKSKRVVRLTGEEINKLTWDLCDGVLQKYFVRNQKQNAEQEIALQVEKSVNQALDKLTSSFKALEGKIDKALTVKATPAPAPVQAAPAPRVQSVQSTPMDVPAMNVAEDDISQNAMRFLQDSNVPDLGIDYMSL